MDNTKIILHYTMVHKELLSTILEGKRETKTRNQKRKEIND